MKSRTFIVLWTTVALLSLAQVALWWAVGAAVTAWHRAQLSSEQARLVEQHVTALHRHLTAQQAAIKQLNALVPTTDQKSQAVEVVEQLATQRQLAATITTVTEEPVKDQLVPLAVTVTVQGQPVALLTYLEAIERLAQINRLRQWSVTVPAAAPSQLLLQVVFYLQAV